MSPNVSWCSKAWLVIALLLLSGAGVSARTAMVDNKLNLRDGPGQQYRVVVVLPAGSTVTIQECRGEWCRVDYRGQRGYVSSVHLGNGGAAFAAAPTPAPVATEYSEADAVRVHQWNDREWRDRYWRERDAGRR